jgi:hypothetical protein
VTPRPEGITHSPADCTACQQEIARGRVVIFYRPEERKWNYLGPYLRGAAERRERRRKAVILVTFGLVFLGMALVRVGTLLRPGFWRELSLGLAMLFTLVGGIAAMVLLARYDNVSEDRR